MRFFDKLLVFLPATKYLILVLSNGACVDLRVLGVFLGIGYVAVKFCDEKELS
jgi:hypothetical protein